MFFRYRIAIGLALLLAFAFAVPVFAGGWAVITLDELPTGVVAGEPLTNGFTVLQHGKTPMADLDPTITATLHKGDQLTVYAEPDGKPGHYAATLSFPKEGNWEWSIQAFSMDQPMPVLSVTVRGVASTNRSFVKTEPTSVPTSPLLIVRILILAIGLAGLIVAVQRKNRQAAVITILCLLASIGLFMAGAGIVSSVEAQGKPSSEALSDSSQVELGRQLFIAKGCVTCHINTKISKNMTGSITLDIGTNLSNFSASPEALRLRLQDPSAVKSDTQMPNLDLAESEIEALIAFINSK